VSDIEIAAMPTIHRRLSWRFYLWLTILAVPVGIVLGNGTAGVISNHGVNFGHLPEESDQHWMIRFEEEHPAADRRQSRLLVVTVAVCILALGLLLYRLSLYRSVISISDELIVVSRFFGSRKRQRKDLVQVITTYKKIIFLPERFTFLKFTVGFSAIIRPAFMANATELEQRARDLVARATPAHSMSDGAA